MATNSNQISLWFDKGVEQNKKYMVIICDTFDWEDYPSYHVSRASAENKINSPGEMQKIMEVYDLEANKTAQLNSARVFAI